MMMMMMMWSPSHDGKVIRKQRDRIAGEHVGAWAACVRSRWNNEHKEATINCPTVLSHTLHGAGLRNLQGLRRRAERVEKNYQRQLGACIDNNNSTDDATFTPQTLSLGFKISWKRKPGLLRAQIFETTEINWISTLVWEIRSALMDHTSCLILDQLTRRDTRLYRKHTWLQNQINYRGNHWNE